MKRVLVFVILVYAVFGGFLAQAKVVCASPQTGKEQTDAGDVNSVCEPNATEGVGGASDRDVNVGQIVYNVTASEPTPQKSSTQGGTGTVNGSSGGQQ